MQKKRIALALLVALVLNGLTACGGATPAGDTTTGPAVAPASSTNGPAAIPSATGGGY